MKLRDYIEHPVALISGFLGAIGLAVKPGIIMAVLMTVWGSAGTIFTASSLFAWTISPNVDALAPYADIFQTLALLAALLFLLKLSDRTFDNFERNL